MLTKILIADSCVEFRTALADALGSGCAVHCCENGMQALEMLRSWKPDFFVLDLALPELDGLGVLKKAKAEGICPPVLVTSSLLNDYINGWLKPYDVVYTVVKPCLISSVAERLQDLIHPAEPQLFFRPSPEGLVSAALMELSVNTGRGGYHYCREAILMLADNPSLQVTKSVYPAISRKYDVAAASVEKAIRDTIAAAYDMRNDDVWCHYFPTAPNGMIPRPTNRAFLSAVAQVVFTVDAQVV